MKKHIIFLVFILIGCKAIQKNSIIKNNPSKHNSNYQPLSTFNSDTLKYIKDNFIKNKAIYSHQPLSRLITYFEIPIKNYLLGIDARYVDSLPDISLEIYSYKERQSKIANKKNPAIIVISWEKQLPMDSVIKLSRIEHGGWGEATKAYLGKQIVKDIQLVNYGF
jgi:hypothetical protein